MDANLINVLAPNNAPPPARLVAKNPSSSGKQTFANVLSSHREVAKDKSQEQKKMAALATGDSKKSQPDKDTSAEPTDSTVKPGAAPIVPVAVVDAPVTTPAPILFALPMFSSVLDSADVNVNSGKSQGSGATATIESDLKKVEGNSTFTVPTQDSKTTSVAAKTPAPAGGKNASAHLSKLDLAENLTDGPQKEQSEPKLTTDSLEDNSTVEGALAPESKDSDELQHKLKALQLEASPELPERDSKAASKTIPTHAPAAKNEGTASHGKISVSQPSTEPQTPASNLPQATSSSTHEADPVHVQIGAKLSHVFSSGHVTETSAKAANSSPKFSEKASAGHTNQSQTESRVQADSRNFSSSQNDAGSEKKSSDQTPTTADAATIHGAVPAAQSGQHATTLPSEPGVFVVQSQQRTHSGDPVGPETSSSQRAASSLPSTHSASESQPVVPGVSAATLIDRLQHSELHLKMDTREFGQVDVRTALDHHELTARIAVERNELGQALTNELPNLHKRLHELEIPYAQISVDQHYSATSGNSDRHSQPQESQNSLPARDGGSEIKVSNTIVADQSAAEDGLSIRI